ncbi:caspase family protein [Bradyrhizobium sp.]|jgi:TPR repeat protein|uniref:caspase family protein n=1 Tax=Bradyrhizobium sp. TaxID=376 RepID=UPI002DDCC358|nr:caspase family protein [Bradyrhizobium sp.]HEV2153003.1 caspase family protein [Bradyrhizobium sp.]
MRLVVILLGALRSVVIAVGIVLASFGIVHAETATDVAACRDVAAYPIAGKGISFEEISAASAIAVCRKALGDHSNNPSLQAYLARALQKSGAEVDLKEAVDLARRSSASGDSEGLMRLGNLFIQGQGVDKDENEGNKLYAQAADRGFPPAQYAVGQSLTRNQKEFSQGVVLVSKAADAGFGPALALMAKFHIDKRLPNSDPEAARKYLDRGAGYGDPDSILIYASMLASGRLGGRDLPKARELYRSLAARPVSQSKPAASALKEIDNKDAQLTVLSLAAQTQNSGAMTELAKFYFESGETHKDPLLGLKLLEQAAAIERQANRPPTPALVQLAAVYATGKAKVVDVSKAHAADLLQIAAKIGDGQAAIKLGEAYAKGDGIVESETGAVSMFRQAGQSSDPAAVLAAAEKFLEGQDVKRNTEIAVQFFERAAGMGQIKAMTELADEFVAGGRLPTNVGRGISLYEQAANAGDVESYVSIATILDSGRADQPKNETLATEYYRRAASKGLKEAMLELAKREEKGKGGPKQVTDAADWLLKYFEKSGNNNGLAALDIVFNPRDLFKKNPDQTFSDVVIELGRRGYENAHLLGAWHLAMDASDDEGVRQAYAYLKAARTSGLADTSYGLARLIDVYGARARAADESFVTNYLEAIASTKDDGIRWWAQYYLYAALLEGRINGAERSSVLKAFSANSFPLEAGLWQAEVNYGPWSVFLENDGKLDKLFTLEYRKFRSILEAGAEIWRNLPAAHRSLWQSIADNGNPYVAAVLAKVSETVDIGDTTSLYAKVVAGGSDGAQAVDEWRSVSKERTRVSAVEVLPGGGGLARACHLTGGDAKVPAVEVRVATKGAIPAGTPISVSWRTTRPPAAGCHSPLYLVVSFPARVRFEGNGFAALTPEARAPFGISHWKDRTRVIVPLHQSAALLNGSLIVRAYDIGAMDIRWALIEVPKFRPESKNAADFSGDKAVVLTNESWRAVQEVRAREPVLFVQDRFSVDAPTRVTYSRTGEYILRDFSGYYRVIDAHTGALIVERPGQEPNFSPTGRFIAAFGGSRTEADTASVEIVDLYTGEIVSSIRRSFGEEGYEARDYRFGAIAWALNDSAVILGYNVYGNIQVRPTLIAREPSEISSDACHACGAPQQNVALDPDNLAVLTTRSGPAGSWATAMLDHRESLTRESEAPDGGFTPWDLWTSASLVMVKPKEAQKADKPLTGLAAQYNTAYEQFFDAEAVIPSYPMDGRDGNHWLTANEKPFSHSYYPDQGVHIERHSPKPVKLDDALASTLASSGELRAVRATRAYDDGRPDTAPLSLPERFRRRLEPFRVYLQPGSVGEVMHAPSETRDYSGDYVSAADRFGRAVQIRVESEINGSSTLFDTRKIGSGFLTGCMESVGHLYPGNVHSLWSWKVSRAKLVALQNQCTNGSAQDAYGHLIILRQTPGAKSGSWIWLTEQLWRGKKLSYYLSTYDPSPLRLTLSHDRYVLIASNGRNPSLVVYDLVASKVASVIENSRSGYLTDKVFLTTDAKRIVQLNSDGQFHIYDLASQAHILAGYFVDDEIVLYDEHWRYDATPEAAQHLFLRFPGLAGFHSFQQFAKSLHRPDIIAALLRGEVAPYKDLPIKLPPSLALGGRVKARSDQSIDLELMVESHSQNNVTGVRIYSDGRQVLERAFTSQVVRQSIAVTVKPETRWISAVAIDRSGTESAVQTIPIPTDRSAPAHPQGRLFVLAVGTDTYTDPRFAALDYAKADAQRFIRAAEAARGIYYSRVESQGILDQADLRHVLPQALHRLVAAANEHDTIMLFAAGHGLLDRAGKFYLATRETSLGRLADTAASWDDIVREIDGSKARVLVFIDACHSGSIEGAATNDDAVRHLIAGRAALTVLAASKGRQFSNEGQEWDGGGGAFTVRLMQAVLNRDKTDTNANGTIEQSELYAALKSAIVAETHGDQTPWIARTQMVGEIPLF